MSFHYHTELPLPSEFKEAYPLPEKMRRQKIQRDREIADIFTGKSDKFLVIIGPCSADREDAVCEYVHRLSRVNEKVHHRLLIIPRIYTSKPRTTGTGYKGMLHQPNPLADPNLMEGLISVRKMHLRAFCETGLSAADELLYPEIRSYLDDLLSYEAIGARSVENQQHRLTASGMDIPVGMKNPTSGDLAVMFHAIYAAQQPQRFIFRGHEVTTDGNPLAHGILRGGQNRYGMYLPNYSRRDLEYCQREYEKKCLLNRSILVDTSHANSNKHFQEQPYIARDILLSRQRNPTLHTLIKGLLIESYLVEGCQAPSSSQTYGQSVTDPCLGWEDTETLLYQISELC